MTENIFEKAMSEEEIEQNIRSLKYRNPFQIYVFKMLHLGNNVEQIMIDRKIISDYIDNPNNSEVRRLIVQNEFAKAAEILFAETNIRVQEDHPKAA